MIRGTHLPPQGAPRIWGKRGNKKISEERETRNGVEWIRIWGVDLV